MNNPKKSNNLIQEVLLLLKPMGDVDYLITDKIALTGSIEANYVYDEQKGSKIMQEVNQLYVNALIGLHFYIGSHTSSSLQKVKKNQTSIIDSNSIGLTLNVPIYSGGSVSAQTAQARYRFVAASENLELAYRSTVRSVRAAYNDVIAATSTIRAFKQAVVSADSALKATEAGFDVGTRTIVDVLNSTRNQFNARQRLAGARYDFITAILNLKRASGNLTEQDLVDINRGLMAPSAS